MSGGRCAWGFNGAVQIEIADTLFQQQNAFHQVFLFHVSSLLLEQAVKALKNLAVLLCHLQYALLQLSS